MRQAFHQGFGSQVNFTVERMSDNPDAQVRHTMDRIRHYILEDAASPFVQHEARRALALGGGDPILGVWRLIRSSMRFQQDSQTAAQLHQTDVPAGDVVEVLIRPRDQALLIMMRGMGFEDCDGYEMYAACLLAVLGVPSALVTVAAGLSEPWRFSHVYLAAYPNGRRIALDFSHGPYPGWEIPSPRIREWPIHSFASQTAVALIASAAAFVGLFVLGRAA
jgi:hypothetical protein